jgi:hypothetical protein
VRLAEWIAISVRLAEWIAISARLAEWTAISVRLAEWAMYSVSVEWVVRHRVWTPTREVISHEIRNDKAVSCGVCDSNDLGVRSCASLRCEHENMHHRRYPVE